MEDSNSQHNESKAVRPRKTPIAYSVLLGIAVIAIFSDIVGLFDWGFWMAVAVIGLATAVGLVNFLIDKRRSRGTPPSLTPVAFAYEEPKWLAPQHQQKLSELAKAAFVLLLFEQTVRGCWGKSYLLRHLPPSETLPAAPGGDHWDALRLNSNIVVLGKTTGQIYGFGGNQPVVVEPHS